MGIYDKVYQSDRPEIFYKGDTLHCAGPNEPIGIRVDSTVTGAGTGTGLRAGLRK